MQQKREKHAATFGTPEHEKIKKLKCEKRDKHVDEIYGTPKHDELKKEYASKLLNYFWN